MKLYTEEQVRKALDLHQDYEDKVFDMITPIELPNDEGIYLANQKEVLSLPYMEGFLDGAWYIKDKLKRAKND